MTSDPEGWCFGPRTQSEQPPHELAARLRGEIEWCAVNPRRGEKLREIFARIDWT